MARLPQDIERLVLRRLAVTGAVMLATFYGACWLTECCGERIEQKRRIVS